MHFQKNLKHFGKCRESIKIVLISPPLHLRQSTHIYVLSNSEDKDTEIGPLFQGRVGSIIHMSPFTFIS